MAGNSQPLGRRFPPLSLFSTTKNFGRILDVCVVNGKMITTIPNVPGNVAAFAANGEVSADDFTTVILPACEQKVEEYGELNYLLQLQNDVPNFTIGAWAQDMVLGLKHITKWNRCAIVTDKKSIHSITDVFSKLVPGEFKGYDQDELQQAIHWCSTGNK